MVQRFHAALTAAFRDPVVEKQLTETQQVKLMTTGPAELKAFFESQMRIWGEVVRDNQIKPS